MVERPYRRMIRGIKSNVQRLGRCCRFLDPKRWLPGTPESINSFERLNDAVSQRREDTFEEIEIVSEIADAQGQVINHALENRLTWLSMQALRSEERPADVPLAMIALAFSNHLGVGTALSSLTVRG